MSLHFENYIHNANKNFVRELIRLGKKCIIFRPNGISFYVQYFFDFFENHISVCTIDFYTTICCYLKCTFCTYIDQSLKW